MNNKFSREPTNSHDHLDIKQPFRELKATTALQIYIYLHQCSLSKNGSHSSEILKFFFIEDSAEVQSEIKVTPQGVLE